MFGLVFGSIATMVRVGFIISVGLLLDTFLARPITVPAMAVLAGRQTGGPRGRCRIGTPELERA